MNFSMEATLEEMNIAMQKIVGDKWEDIQGYAKQIMNNEKEALRQLAEQRLKGEITEEEFESELEDEKHTVEAELKALDVLTKAMAQKAANAALDVLYKAIKAAL